MRKTLANFCLDAAKIVFGSLVVGVFIPGTRGPFPWLTWLMGIMATVAFIIITGLLSKKKEDPWI